MEEVKNLNTKNDAVIPAFIRYDSNLSTGAKFLYSELSAQCYPDNSCELRDVELMVLLTVSIKTIKNWVSELVKSGYLEKEMIYYRDTNIIVGRKLIIKN